MIISFWRNRRIAKIETGIFMNFHPSQPEKYGDMTGVLGRLARHESSIDRTFYRASKELQTLQKARICFARQNGKQTEPTEQSSEPPAAAVAAAQTIAVQSPPAQTPQPAVKRYRQEPNGKLVLIAP